MFRLVFLPHQGRKSEEDVPLIIKEFSLIDWVEVNRGYKLNIVFNLTYQQFMGIKRSILLQKLLSILYHSVTYTVNNSIYLIYESKNQR